MHHLYEKAYWHHLPSSRMECATKVRLGICLNHDSPQLEIINQSQMNSSHNKIQMLLNGSISSLIRKQGCGMKIYTKELLDQDTIKHILELKLQDLPSMDKMRWKMVSSPQELQTNSTS